MSKLGTETTEIISWPEEGVTRVPYQVYMDPSVYEQEQLRIYRGPTWNFLALEAELPQSGDYKTTFVGDTPVVVTRDRDGEIRAFVNRCSHRGATVCMDSCGNTKTFTCVYHAWAFDAKGDLKGVPFRSGVEGKGGMPEDFDTSKHALHKLRIETFCGVIFGSFDPHVMPLQEYLGEKMCGYIRRVFNRPVRVLGYNRQSMNNNWKIYFENVKDSYHASILHTFFSTFGLNRLSQRGGIDMDDTGMHHVSYTYGSSNENEDTYKQANLRSFNSKYKLEDPTMLEGRKEFADGITLAIQSIFPGMVLQQIHNTLAVRQLLPKGPEKCELHWTYFGYEDDDDQMTTMRMKQSNLVGPAGFVSLEDGGVGELVQRGIVRDKDKSSFVEMGGKTVQSQEFRATETSIRGFWKRYRELMGY
ncbi:aromatic ring-hydroxylating dioxygenase subunit alpha [Paenibacillus naphthalenovorans]|uniref:aromatic ring-hydroxylating dioxygenase subunit alpha n=2 Tax=Paenibacillus naphthalenovorans TaxID=162209 RepID=UPI0008805FC9|nr:aromatic ring-hydroxylating dioxygenase subunit alpha [Paenibacillus naphthalenovorans]GCL71493.1 Rieske (2Fe-2S) protein [Paenibacillus naphthalenovorans]SDI83747.1 anthranilate 1,2-dioxygenase large subunit/terephthalate 1,2-dioxygenase oxygenase component alpha subunit [Paenibacillus naphthalenovorans]